MLAKSVPQSLNSNVCATVNIHHAGLYSPREFTCSRNRVARSLAHRPPRLANGDHATAITCTKQRSAALTPSLVRHEQSTPQAVWDVVGYGQAMVDCNATVTDEFLDGCDVQKGERRVINIRERGELLERLRARNLEVCTGGSLANTLLALGRLSSVARDQAPHRKLRVGLAGSIGEDTLGQYFQAHLQSAGVHVISDVAGAGQYSLDSLDCPLPDGAARSAGSTQTGTVMVLTTDDAQRSFLSFFPPDTATTSPTLLAAVSSARVLIIEGYMWELPGATEAIPVLIRHARRHGTLVVLTAGDKGVVSRHRSRVLDALQEGVDIMFANAAEAAAVLGGPARDSVEASMQLAALCQIAVVTDGSRGSCIAALGQVHVTPPVWSRKAPVDTCGAGDAYAAGALFALLSGHSMATVGQAGARLAASVIARRGAQVLPGDAEDLCRLLAQRKGTVLEPVTMGSIMASVSNK